jgi:ribosomal protein L15
MSKKRLGRGYGSGKGGHTSSRGQKGQKSRRKMHVLFEGLKVKKSTLKKFPLLRGKGKFHAKPKSKERYVNKALREVNNK